MVRVKRQDVQVQLSDMLDRTRKGEVFVITEHDLPVARLVPCHLEESVRLAQSVNRLKQLRKGVLASGLSIEEMINESRRR